MKKFALIALNLTVGISVWAYPGFTAPANVLIGARNRGVQQDSANNLKQIASALTMYLTANDDVLPENFSALAEYLGGGRIFVASFDKKSRPSATNEIKPQNTSFAYVGNLGRISALNNTAATPIAFEKPWLLPAGQNRINVLFADGHVEMVHLPANAPKTCHAAVKHLCRNLKNKVLTDKLIKNAINEDKAKNK